MSWLVVFNHSKTYSTTCPDPHLGIVLRHGYNAFPRHVTRSDHCSISTLKASSCKSAPKCFCFDSLCERVRQNWASESPYFDPIYNIILPLTTDEQPQLWSNRINHASCLFFLLSTFSRETICFKTIKYFNPWFCVKSRVHWQFCGTQWSFWINLLVKHTGSFFIRIESQKLQSWRKTNHICALNQSLLIKYSDCSESQLSISGFFSFTVESHKTTRSNDNYALLIFHIQVARRTPTPTYIHR